MEDLLFLPIAKFIRCVPSNLKNQSFAEGFNPVNTFNNNQTKIAMKTKY